MIRLLLPLLALLIAAPAFAADKLVVYSARKEQLIKPVFDAYTAATGVEIEYITDKEGPLVERLKAEGRRTPADLLITVDAGNLWYAAEQGVLAPVESKALITNVPEHLRDPQSRWFGLSLRARAIVYHTDRVGPADLKDYVDLTGAKWKNRLVLRTSKKVYNQSLTASLIMAHGEDKAEEIVRGWVANLAAPPTTNDTKAMQALVAGVGDVAVVNSYYYGRLMRDKPETPLALFFPSANTGGTHVNVSGAGVTTHAPHREQAVKFLEWLSMPEAQRLFADLNMEYPVNPAVEPAPLVAAWGAVEASTLPVADFGVNQARAIKLMDRAGYK